MLPLRYRLNLRHQPYFFTAAQRYYSPLFTIFYQIKRDQELHNQQNEDKLIKTKSEFIKAAVVVPKKAIRLATHRNKVKRQVLQAIYSWIREKENKDEEVQLLIAVVIKSQVTQKSFEVIKHEISQALDQISKNK